MSEEMAEEIENTTPVNSRAVSSSGETPDVSHQAATASYQRSRPQLSSLDSLLDDSTEATQSHSGKFVCFWGS